MVEPAYGIRFWPVRSSSISHLATAALVLLWLSGTSAVVYPSNHELYKFDYHPLGPHARFTKRSLTKRENPIPLVVTNNCDSTIWPGIATQHGEGTDSNGFELGPGRSRNMSVGPTWQGRIWGRTNCTTGNDTAVCSTGDCFGKLDCEFSVSADDALEMDG
jgi:hypothetical protein